MFLQSHKPMRILVRHRRLIVLSGGVFAFAALVISVLFPLEYRAEAQVLIIAKSRSGVDPYTIAKSAERVGENIAAVMKTDDFFTKVMLQNAYPIDRTRFENISERSRRKHWVSAVKASMVYGTGVLNVATYGKSVESARALAGAVTDTLVQKGWEYVGGDVTIKVVNQPVATRFPARPNVPLNVFFGFFIGSIFTSVLVLRRR